MRQLAWPKIYTCLIPSYSAASFHQILCILMTKTQRVVLNAEIGPEPDQVAEMAQG